MFGEATDHVVVGRDEHASAGTDRGHDRLVPWGWGGGGEGTGGEDGEVRMGMRMRVGIAERVAVFMEDGGDGDIYGMGL